MVRSLVGAVCISVCLRVKAGEVYVLNDGGEVDLDLGNYERYLNVTLSRDNNITTGKIYREVIEKEVRIISILSTIPSLNLSIIAPGRLLGQDSPGMLQRRKPPMSYDSYYDGPRSSLMSLPPSKTGSSVFPKSR